MVEYIERDAVTTLPELPKANRHYQTDNLDDAYGQGWDDALCCIGNIPAADVAPVVHARWIPFHSEVAGDIQYCSDCGIAFGAKTNYCPNCGAKMDLEADHETN